jgi:hypothetical protein
MNTILGKDKFLFLRNEIEQHFCDKKIDSCSINYINNYINTLKSKVSNFFFLIVPDKSVVCLDKLPDEYNKDNISRKYAEILKIQENVYDLYENMNVEDYCITDSHINFVGGLKISKLIISYLISKLSLEDINLDDSHLNTTIYKNFRGDLTSKINLNREDETLFEDLKILSFNSYKDIIKTDKINFRFCLLRKSKHVVNLDAKIKKKILIFGDSTTSIRIFDFLTFYFEDIFFYWNHLQINNELIEEYNPDILLDIRTERFLVLGDYFVNKIINSKIQNFTYNEIVNNLSSMSYYELKELLKIINNSEEIMNNSFFFSKLCTKEKGISNFNIDNILDEGLKEMFMEDMGNIIIPSFVNLLKTFKNIPINFNSKLYKKLNDDLKHLNYIEVIIHYENYGYNEKRKYVPVDFDPEIYKRLNEDLKFMNSEELLAHYQKYGFDEKRKYKYSNIPDDFYPEIYKELNNDLEFMNSEELLTHYENYGYNEKRQYKIIKDIQVFIYCGGKCGSSTLNKTFLSLNYNCLHVHSNKCYESVYKYLIDYTNIQTLKELISIQEFDKVYIIDVYRDPFERLISSFFQLDLHKLGNNYKSHDISICNYFLYKSYKFESYHPLDEEYPVLKDLPFISKYIYHVDGRNNYIKLKFKDIDNWSEYLSEIFEKEIPIISGNVSENKEYSELYKEFKKQFVISQEMFDYFTSSFTFKKYNSLEEQEEYKNKWNLKIRPNEYFKELLDNAKYVNCPENFNIEQYKILNPDLQELNDYELRYHYELYGHIEGRNY